MLLICKITRGGVDYNSGPYTVTFSAGQIGIPFDVSIIDDKMLEGNEIFNLAIDALLLPNRVIVASPHETTVTIVDNDGKYT